MLLVTRTPDQVHVSVTTERPPLIYLDQCAIYEFSRLKGRAERFRDLFRTRGELLLSYSNLMELGLLQGASAHRVRTLLSDAVGLHWIPIEASPLIVAERELKGQQSPSPTISESLLEETCATDGEPTVAKLIGLFIGAEISSHREFMEFARRGMAGQIEVLRHEYLKDPDTLLRRFPKLPITDRSRMLYVISEVLRRVVEAAKGPYHFRWQPNDALDMAHAIVALRSAHVVVLDGKWKPRVEGITETTIFSSGEFDAFLDWLEAFPVAVPVSDHGRRGT